MDRQGKEDESIFTRSKQKKLQAANVFLKSGTQCGLLNCTWKRQMKHIIPNKYMPIASNVGTRYERRRQQNVKHQDLHLLTISLFVLISLCEHSEERVAVLVSLKILGELEVSK